MRDCFLPCIHACPTALGLALSIAAFAGAHAVERTVETALGEAGTNRPALEVALRSVPAPQRGAMEFLVTNMPPRDLQSLSADFLLENVTLAYQAWAEAPWGKRISTELFLNEVLPYASLSESRDNWRKRLYEVCRPLVKDCRTTGEAAQTLNRELFKILNVRYSTQRRAAIQGPFETIDSGMATCTGLAILLVDACRSVGIPARVVGTPMWVNNTGNHTWVEIWDGDWHFTGAAEPSPEGLDRGWFTGNASQALKDERRHAIYAVSFQRTGLTFPLGWGSRSNEVPAVNVTDRYTAGAPARPPPTALRLMVDVFDRPAGERVPANVAVRDCADSKVRFTGTSKGSTADMNDRLTFEVPFRRTLIVEFEHEGKAGKQFYTSGTNAQDRLTLFLGGIPPVEFPPPPAYPTNPAPPALRPKDRARLAQCFNAFFQAMPQERDRFQFPAGLERLLVNREPAVRQLAWECFRSAPIHDALKRDFDARQVRFENHLSPYTLRTIGTRPTNGWALFIAMHGGGGAPQELNDQQWRQMQVYYRDHPEAGGYHYVALRAPNNEWNGFYAGYVYPLIQNLLRQFLLFGDVDPNKKFVMGYSHGGYGAFAIGPKMPDHFAAVHASGAALADGAVALTLRNTYFSCMLGSKDTMYGRYDRIREFQEEIRKLRGNRTDIYPVSIQIIADHPHSGLPDRDKIADLYPAVRNPVPRELAWRLTDSVIRDFFWLRAPEPQPGAELTASCRDNVVSVTASTKLAVGSVLLDGRLVDLKEPVRLEVNGKRTVHRVVPSLRTLCETMDRRGDPELAFTVEIPLSLAGAASP